MAPHGLGRYGRPHSDGAGYKGHLMARPVREVRTGRYSMERVEINYFIDTACKESGPDHPPLARFYKAPVQR